MAGDCAFLLLVPVLTSTHLLLASAAASPGALGVLPYFPWGCAHTCGWVRGFSSASYLPFALLWALGILVPVASLLHLVPYRCDGVTPAGSRIVCPRSERRFSLSIWVRYTGQFLAGAPASVCGFLHALFLRVCCQVVLAVSFTFGFPYLSPGLFTVPCWGSVLPPRLLLGVWGCLSYPTLFSAGWGWCLGR